MEARPLPNLPAALTVPTAADSSGYILPSRGVVAAMSPLPKPAGEDTGPTGTVRSARPKNPPGHSRPGSRRCALICRVDPLALDLTPDVAAAGRLRIEFLTPTEIKGGDQAVARPEFGTLFARLATG